MKILAIIAIFIPFAADASIGARFNCQSTDTNARPYVYYSFGTNDVSKDSGAWLKFTPRAFFGSEEMAVEIDDPKLDSSSVLDYDPRSDVYAEWGKHNDYAFVDLKRNSKDLKKLTGTIWIGADTKIWGIEKLVNKNIQVNCTETVFILKNN